MKRGLFSIAAALYLIAAVSIASAQDSYSQQQSQTQSQTQDPNATTDQTQQSTDQTTTDQTTTETLPATASPLPLLGFIGLLTLAAGVWVIRARRRA